MALSDFLTEGSRIPEGSALKASTSQTVLPDWYTNYTMDLLAGQKAISERPYTTYQGPRVAGFTPTQQHGFDMTATAAGSYLPALNAATNATTNLMGSTALSTASPWFAAATQADPTGAAQRDYGAARTAIGNALAINPSGGAMDFYSQSLGLDPRSTAMPSLAAARGQLGRASGMSAASTASPYYASAMGYNPASAASPFFNQALASDAAGAARPYFDQAGSISALDTASPYFGDAARLAVDSTNPMGINYAMPYANRASGTVEDVSSYMNPYIDSVVSRIADLGSRNLYDSILPELEGRYITSGQWRGSGQLTDTMRAVRDTSNDILGRQSEALMSGYRDAQGAKGSDLSRFAGLADLMGGLGVQQQQRIADAGRTLADIGTTAGGFESDRARMLADIGSRYGGYESDRANRLMDIGARYGDYEAGSRDFMAGLGSSMAGFTANDRDAYTGIASRLADMGFGEAGLTADRQKLLADIGSRYGDYLTGDRSAMFDASTALSNLGTSQAGLSEADRRWLSEMGVNTANIAGADTTRGLSGAQQLSDLASRYQNLGLTGADAVTGIGNREQAMNQTNLDIAYADFLRQMGYPQEQINAMLQTYRGVAPGVPTATVEEGIVPTGNPTQYKPSTASQIAAGVTGAAGVLDLLRDVF